VISTQRKKLDTQRQQLETQQRQIDTLQKRIAELETENQRLWELAALPEKYENVKAFVTKNIVQKAPRRRMFPYHIEEKPQRKFVRLTRGKKKPASWSSSFLSEDANSSRDKSCQQPLSLALGKLQLTSKYFERGLVSHGKTWVACCKR